MLMLNKGLNFIYLPESYITKKGVGIIPVCESVVSSQGLKWDLKSYKTGFGSDNLSCCNVMEESDLRFIIESGDVVFSCELDFDLINK